MDNQTKSTKPGNESVGGEYVLSKYDNAIKYYWNAGKTNKRSYKFTRTIVITLGACVTLFSSLGSAEFIPGGVKTLFAILTPVLAAILTITGGLANSFHWGATWRDMTINASILEKDRDIFLATKPEERDIKTELAKINESVIEETGRFFQRVLDTETRPDDE